MAIDNIKLNKNDMGGFAFGEPDLVKLYEFNFSTEWIVNPDNSDGIVIEDNVITISKVKPNTWFIKSNYGFTTAADRNAKFYNKTWNINGVTQANSDGLIGDGYTFFINWAGTPCKGWGLVISPVNSSNTLMCSTNDGCDQMGIYSGSFKNGWGDWPGALNFGTRNDGQRALYNGNVNGYPTYGEVALGFFSSVEADADGYINFNTPITISCVLLSQVVDPTTKEAFSVSLGDTILFEKEKNFENLLINHQLGFKDVNVIGEIVQGDYGPEILDPKGYAYVISNNRCKHYTSGKYKDTGQPITIPIPTDLFELIENNEPVKFFCTQTDKDKQTGLWYNVVKYFKEHDITTPFFAENLFSKSNVNGSDYTDGDGWVDINIDCDNCVIDGCFDHCGIDPNITGVEYVRFNVNGGKISKTRNVFRQSRYWLKEVRFVNNVNQGEHVCPDMLSGMFEYCGLNKFPEGLGFSNTETSGNHSEPTCCIQYVAHGSVFSVFGNLKPDGTRYELLVEPNCLEAFNTSDIYGMGDNLTEILCDLDMKFVDPCGIAQNVFNCSKLQKVRIKNLNKGIWSLDNVNHGGTLNGNLASLDEDSANYLVSNVYDLKQNENGDATKTEYTEGLYESSIYLPSTLKEKVTEESLSIAKDRGWSVYFGGELAN